MQQFKLFSDIRFYDTLSAFLTDVSPGDGDLILANRAVWEQFLRPLSPACPVLVTTDFGGGEPTTDRVDAIRQALPKGLRRIVAIGGGTVLDIAKMLSLRVDKTEDLFLGAEPPGRVLEVWAVPATCGTGSEVTNACAAELTGLHTKRGYSSDLLYPAAAVLIPELLRGLPYRAFAASAIDALIHAAESFLSPRATPHSLLFSREAVRLLLQGFLYTAEQGPERWTDLTGDFLLASNYAGLAFSSAGCGAVHALSYPLGGGYHIPHGEANHLVFAAVFRKYREKRPVGRINELEALLGACLNTPDALEAAFALLDRIQPRRPLREYGVAEDALSGFAQGVEAGQQRLLRNNYAPLTTADMVEIYRSVY